MNRQTWLRVADTDRQATADRLGLALTQGRLQLDEYDQRLRQAYAATRFAELDALVFDLPVLASQSRPPPATRIGHRVGDFGTWIAGLPVGCVILATVLIVAFLV